MEEEEEEEEGGRERERERERGGGAFFLSANGFSPTHTASAVPFK